MGGAVSIVAPIANLTKAQWAETTYISEYLRAIGHNNIPGIAYGWNDDEINHARTTLSSVRKFLFESKQWALSTVPVFLRDCVRYSNGERKNFEGALLVRDAFPRYNQNESFIKQYLNVAEHDGYGREKKNATRNLRMKINY